MLFQEQWTAIVTSIKGLQEAGRLFAQFQSYQIEDKFNVSDFLRDQCVTAVESISQFRNDHDKTLPDVAKQYLDNFLNSKLVVDAVKAPDSAPRVVRALAPALVGLEASLPYILSDRQEFIRRRSERAFLHLQRSLFADEEFSAKWVSALGKGETECERLGSVHLLLHGIYAFKVGAHRAETDLLFNERSCPMAWCN